MNDIDKELTELLRMKRARRDAVRAEGRKLNKEIRDLETKIAAIFSERTEKAKAEEDATIAAYTDASKMHWTNTHSNKLNGHNPDKYPHAEDMHRESQ